MTTSRTRAEPADGDAPTGVLDLIRADEPRRVLAEWMSETGTSLRYAGWQDRGNSGAQVFAAYAERRADGRAGAGDARKLIIKVLPPRGTVRREPDLHVTAQNISPPDFVARHLTRQLAEYPALPLGGNGWIMFQEIAGGSLEEYRALAALMDVHGSGAPGIAELCGRVVQSVLTTWNSSDSVGFTDAPASRVLGDMLGFRIEQGGTLHSWAAHDPGLLAAPRPTIAVDGESRDLPNPFALVTGPRLADEGNLAMLTGLAHGDLHPGNVVCRKEYREAPDDLRFIDLSRFGTDVPLVCDPAHFLLSVVARHLAAETAPEVRIDLARYLVEPSRHRPTAVRVGLRDIVDQVHGAERNWVEGSRRGLLREWHEHRLLALIGCALIFTGRSALGRDDRLWFFHLAARASAAYLRLVRERRSLAHEFAETAANGGTLPGSRGEGGAVPVATPVNWRTPRPVRVAYHMPRQQELRRIHDLLGDTGRPVVISGAPGTGKTQLAIDYCRSHGSTYDHVAWMSAQRVELLVQSFSDLARRCGLAMDVTSRLDALLECLSRSGRWLFVFDDADSPATVRRFVRDADPRWTVLVTSRTPHWSQLGERFELRGFDRRCSTSLLTRRVDGLSDSDADRIAEVLGDLPLALDQAAQYLEGSPVGAEQYVRHVERRTRQMLDRGIDPDVYPTSLAATLDIALDRLLTTTPEAVELLRLCACFAAEPIPYEMLENAGSRLPPGLAALVGDAPDRLSDVVKAASAAGLLRVQDRSGLTMHQLFARYLRAAPADVVAEARECARSVVADADPGGPRAPHTWETYRALLPHVLELDLPASTDPTCHRTYLHLVYFLTVRGDTRTARHLAQDALTRWRTAYGHDADVTVAAMEHLARAEVQLGNYRAAVELDERVIAQRSRLGDEHPDTVTAKHNLASDLMALTANAADPSASAARRAERLQRWIVEVRTRQLGHGHKDTLLAQHNLALLLRGRRELLEALPLHRTVYEGLVEVLGSDHPDTLRAAHGYALSLRDSGEDGAARDLNADIHRQRLSVLGPDHPDVLRSAYSRAYDLRACGDRDRARELLEDAYDRGRNVLGQNHPDTLRFGHWLAVVQSETGAEDRAEPLIADVHRRRQRILGDTHLDTLRSAAAHAALLRASGDAERAAALELVVARLLPLQLNRGIRSDQATAAYNSPGWKPGA
jgi:hypothetical protein